jgi:hypothetical protein
MTAAAVSSVLPIDGRREVISVRRPAPRASAARNAA